MYLVIIVCIACLYVRQTWYIHFIRPQHLLFLLCVCLKLFVIIPLELSSSSFFFICPASDSHLFNIPATYYPCSFFSFCYQEFLTVNLLIFGADENGGCQPWNFSHPQCPFCIRFEFIGQWDQALSVKSHWNNYVFLFTNGGWAEWQLDPELYQQYASGLFSFGL